MENNNVYSRLPHRAPMLMVDAILELDEVHAVAYKEVTADEPCFQGHFPGNPVFPGVLTIEAMAQTASLVLSESEPDHLPVFAGVQAARFLLMIRPGDRLVMTAHQKSRKKNFYIFDTTAKVNGICACEAELTIYSQSVNQKKE